MSQKNRKRMLACPVEGCPKRAAQINDLERHARVKHVHMPLTLYRAAIEQSITIHVSRETGEPLVRQTGEPLNALLAQETPSPAPKNRDRIAIALLLLAGILITAFLLGSSLLVELVSNNG